MNEEKITKQAKANKTLKTVLSVLMYLILAIIISFGILLICADAGLPVAQEIIKWLNDKFGIVVGVTALTVMMLLLKALISVYSTTNNADAKNAETIAEILKVRDDVLQANKDTQAAAEKVIEASQGVVSRNGVIDDYKASIDKLSEQQGVLFETMKLFVTANTNDVNIKSIFKKFEETQLFEKARKYSDIPLIEKVGDAIENVVEDVAESTKDIIKPNSDSSLVKVIKRK